jgi:hypothetical protein
MSAQRNGKAPSVTAATLPPLSPEGILSEYRRLSPPDIQEQAAQFRRMQNSAQRELLFYMIAHATKGVMLLQQALDPENKSGMNYHDMSPTKQ